MASVYQVPAARTQFVDANGAPLTGGSVATYVPGTTVPLFTYQDASATIMNTNPIILDGIGSSAIWYDGLVRMVVKDALGNQIYDQVGGAPNSTSQQIQAQIDKQTRIDVRKYGAVGGNLAKDDAAFDAAYAEALSLGGGIVYVPPLAGGRLRISAKTFAAPDGVINRVVVEGDGFASEIETTSACDYLFDFQGVFGGLRNISIVDLNNYVAKAAWRTKFAGAVPIRDWGCSFDGVTVFGGGVASTMWAWENDGMGASTAENVLIQNALGFLNSVSGGVGMFTNRIYGIGLKYALRADKSDYGGQPEGWVHSTWCMNCTTASAIGVDIRAGLHHIYNDVLIVQLNGGNATACKLGGVSGIRFLTFNNCFLEGSNGGYAIYSRGDVREVVFNGGGTGQGSQVSTVINAIDIDGVDQITFQNFNAFFPSGNAGKVFAANNCTYKVIDCFGWDRTTNANTSTNSTGNWVRSAGVPTARSLTDSYPQATWTTVTGLATVSGGGALGSGATTSVTVRRDGKTISGRGTTSVPLKGTGTGSVVATLPSALAGISANQMCSAIRERGVTGSSAYQAYIANNTIVILSQANGFPCAADGYIFDYSFTYELA